MFINHFLNDLIERVLIFGYDWTFAKLSELGSFTNFQADNETEYEYIYIFVKPYP